MFGSVRVQRRVPEEPLRPPPDGEPGLNYFCAGYKSFFTHIDRLMSLMADRVRNAGYADEVMDIVARAPRNEPCPCGNG
jgi:uncharacterized protein